MTTDLDQLTALPDEHKAQLAKDVLDALGITLKTQTHAELIIPCPVGAYHNDQEHNPTAALNYKKLLFHCLGCDASGTILWLIATVRGDTTIDQARDWLLSEAGLTRAVGLPDMLAFFDALYTPKTRPPMPVYSPRMLERWQGVPDYITRERGIPIETCERMGICLDPDGYVDRVRTGPRAVIPHYWEGKLVGWQSRRLPSADPTSPKYLSCVPVGDTEMLTEQGWKRVDDLSVGERVASVDKTGHLRYVPLLGISRGRYSGPMVHIKNSVVDQLLTPNHKVWTWDARFEKVEPAGGRGYHRAQDDMKRCPRCGENKPLDAYPIFPSQVGKYCKACWNKAKVVLDSELTARDAADLESLPRGVTGVGLPCAARSYEMSATPLGVDVAELYGWILAEGSVTQYEVRIYQTAANQDHIENIRDLLTRLAVPFTETSRTRTHSGQFPVGQRDEWKGKEYSETLFRILTSPLKRQIIDDFGPGKKRLDWRRITQLPKDEAWAFLEGFRKGDGTDWDPDNASLVQKDRATLDWLQVLCVHLGLRTSLGRYLQICKRDSVFVAKSKKKVWLKQEEYSGEVWCPRTEDGTWVARRNGKVFITGNSPAFPRDETIFDHRPLRTEVVVVESPMSQLRHQHHSDIEGTFGAVVTDEQIEHLVRGRKKLIWFMDNDPAGWRAVAGRTFNGRFYPGAPERASRWCQNWVVQNPFAADPADMSDALYDVLVTEYAVPWQVWEQPKVLYCHRCFQPDHRGACR